MAEKVLGFRVDVQGVTTEAQELAALEVRLKTLRKEKLELQKVSMKEGVLTNENRQKLAALNTEINKATAAQKQLKQAITPTQSSFVKLGKTLLASAGIFMGLSTIVRGLFNVIKNGLKTTWAFEAAMANVQAVSRATKEEFNALRTSAIALGGSTKFTATEVAGLQKEYAKLGFSAAEILKITSATLSLAAATGSDLAFAAMTAGSTLRQFQLDGTEMQRVVDVMALSFSKTALDMEKFTTAMQHAGPVAKAVGETIETTTAKLGVLANSGLDASISGTSLRNIYLELERRGLTWNEAMIKIQSSQNKASTSLQLFGKRGAVAGLILAENTEEVDSLAGALDEADGSAKEMADIMLDNVEGSITILKSSWEGLILRINESSGAIKILIDGLSSFVRTIGTIGKPSIDSLFETRTIDSFSDRFKVFADAGKGFFLSFSGATAISNKRTQEFYDTISAGLNKKREAEQAIEDARLAAEAEDKQANEDRLKRLQAEVDAAEALLEREEKIYKTRLKAAQQAATEKKIEETEADRVEKEMDSAIEEMMRGINAKNALREQEREDIKKDAISVTKITLDELKKRKDAELALEQASHDAKMNLAASITNLIAGIAGKNKALRKASLIADKALAIAEVIIQTKKANAATRAWGAIGGPIGMVLAEASVMKNNIAAGINIAAIIAAAATGIAGMAKGGKITKGAKINTGTKDDTLILANKTETVLTSDHVRRLGGSGIMKKIGVPGYAAGGYIGQQVPDIPDTGFDMQALARMMNSIEVRLDINKVRSASNEIDTIIERQAI